MYLSNIKLWNFRKFGGNGEFNLDNPNLDLNFTEGLNVLIGENDSGKSAIIDAIKLVLKTHSWEWIKVEDEDFYNQQIRFRIELKFEALSDDEAKHFIEWLGWAGEGENIKPFLKLIYDCKRNKERIFPCEVKAGADDEGDRLSAEAKEYLKTTYLKPLRDAASELIPKKNSRLSNILREHEAFKGKEVKHDLFRSFQEFNNSIENYFEGKGNNGNPIEDQNGLKLKKEIDNYIKGFFTDEYLSKFDVTEAELKKILEKLKLSINEEINPGLGTLNRLFMAAELLHLKKNNWSGLRLGLIEELEAHIHPQAQMQIIESLKTDKNIQLILTTHSPNLASKVDLKNLIICNNKYAFPMGDEYTELINTDYTFLERFLDTTKANLFFAKGVILVEGWAEELIIPALARKIDIDLTKKGVSVVNIGNTAFLRYSGIFKRKNSPKMNIPVAVITDVDIKPDKEESCPGSINKKIKDKKEKYNGQCVQTFVSPYWTLEYCIARSKTLRKIFYKAVLLALKEQKEDDGVKVLDKYIEAIDNLENYFNKWKDSVEAIASQIYSQILGKGVEEDLVKAKISKSIIAQHFAKLLEEESISNNELKKDTNIKYLLDAINYASGIQNN